MKSDLKKFTSLLAPTKDYRIFSSKCLTFKFLNVDIFTYYKLFTRTLNLLNKS